MRVVSLNCSNTEIVHALGQAHLLVGVDSDSDWPPEVVRDLPRLGRDLDVRAEDVAALRPDLVLASLTVPGHERVVADLEATGLPLLAPATRSLADVYADVRAIAAALGVPERGQELVASMQAALVAHPDPAGPRVLVQWWPKPVIPAGRRSWVHELLELCGARNAFDRDVESAPLDEGDVVALAPDIVVMSWCGVRTEHYRDDEVYKHEAWRALPFWRDREVWPVPEAFLGRPGPRLVEGHAALRRLVTGWHERRAGRA